MCRMGNPDDSAPCGPFLKSLQNEEVYRQEYCDPGEVLASIGDFIDRVYNERRLRPALGCRSPSEFERMLINRAATVYGHTFLTRPQLSQD